jgi:hypothetical protein
MPLQTSFEHVSNTIEIDAPPAVVWKNVIRFDEIQPAERKWLFAYAVGIPAPVKATLDREAVGGLRQGIFANGLTFHEVIQTWEPHRRVSFSIKPFAPSVYAPFDQIGSRYLDLLDAEYSIDSLPGGKTRLTLSSRHRVSTRYNFYSTTLTRFFMSEFQGDLLRIVKLRAEK